MNTLLMEYINGIKTATSLSNLRNNLRPLLSRNFTFSSGNHIGKKNEFSNHILLKLNLYVNPKINNNTIKFKNITQKITIQNNKITHINEKISQSGGIGYTYSVQLNPIAGKPVINSYYNSSRPIFNGDLLKGGKQKGGKFNTGYTLDLENNHINVLPQYRAISNK